MITSAFLNDVKIINSIYHAFYNKYPDYKKEDRYQLTIEMQAMFYILSKYSCVGMNYNFVYNNLIDYKMPISMELQDILVNAMLNSDDIDPTKTVEMKQQIKKQLNNLGLLVCNYTKDFDLESLRLLASILYIREYIYPTAKEKKIAEFSSCSIDEVTTALELRDKFLKETKEKTKKKVKKNKTQL